jgi:hypothetical protein
VIKNSVKSPEIICIPFVPAFTAQCRLLFLNAVSCTAIISNFIEDSRGLSYNFIRDKHGIIDHQGNMPEVIKVL